MKISDLTHTHGKRGPRKGAGHHRRLALGAQQVLMGLAAFRAAHGPKPSGMATRRKGDKS